MVEKVLHGVNVAACCGQLATAVDLSLTGGAGLTIGAALSGLAMLKKESRETRNMASTMAAALDKALNEHGPRDSRRAIALQLFAQFPPTESDIARGDKTAAIIAHNMRAQAEAKGEDPARLTQTALDDYERLVKAAVAPLVQPKSQYDADSAETLARQTAQTAMQSEMLDILRSQTAFPQLLQAGISEEAILGQIRRVSEDTTDLSAALTDLQAALTRLANFEAEAKRPTNQSSHVDDAVAQAGALVNEDRATDARTLLAETRARAAADIHRLLSKEIEVALIDGDAKGAAALIAEQADHDAGGRAAFAVLRKLQDDYNVQGRDKGTALELRVSIALAHLLADRAGSADETGAALNDLGISLTTLGERESGTDRLELAVAAYTDALKERTRDRVPLQWAATQNNLGNALQTLGEREGGTDRLEQAVAAYTDALKEYTRDRVPLDWAMTQNNLGNALQTLGQRESGTDRLEQAVAAYTDALKERTRDRVPLDWAATQNNLGLALWTLGQRESGTDRLEQAVAAYTDALKERTRDRVPLDWAMTQNNLGNALRTLGERESGTDRLEQAVAAYTDALKERTRDRVPLDWAMTQNNLGNALQTLGERESGTDRLEQAVAAYRDALKERTRDRVPLGWAATQNNLGLALWTLGQRESGTDRLEQAVAAFTDALKERTRDRVPLQWAMTKYNLAETHMAFFAKTSDPEHMHQAHALTTQALEVFEDAGASHYADVAKAQLAKIDAALKAP